MEEPFFLRLVNLSTLCLATSDRTHPVIKIAGVPDGKALRERLRHAIEARGDQKQVREVDYQV